ncbi:MAG: SprT family zinc-dependent metalloprotease [Spirochaetia bacterium]|jgi:predicted metal-dependent hydrolase
MRTLNLGSEIIPYSITYSLKAKRKRIVIAPSGIRVVLPQGSAEEEGIELIESKKKTVFTLRARVLQQEKRFKDQIDIQYVSGARIPFLGREIPLLVSQEKRKRSRLEYDGTLVVRVQAGLASQDVRKEVKRRVEGWIKEQMREEALQVIAVLGKKIGILPKGLRIKGQKRVWGSCGRNHVINLNWRLSLFRREVFEYVIAHEMCHLRHMNHSKDYWKLVASIVPEYEKYRDWLKFRGYGSP